MEACGCSREVLERLRMGRIQELVTWSKAGG